MLKLQGIYTVPQWCLCYLANGDWDNMTEREKEAIDRWYKEEFPNGCIFDFGDGVFNAPRFKLYQDIYGLCAHCDCQDIAAYTETNEEKFECVSIVAIEDNLCNGIRVTVQENLPFTDWDTAELWAEWRYGYAKYELKHAEQFDFIHEKCD